jgi:hypothetical protein
MKSIGILILGLLGTFCGKAQSPYSWQPASTNSLLSRIAAPTGFQRESVPRQSFANWLRHLPLKPAGTPVRLFNGALKANQSVHHALIDIDTGNRDLQQCADAVMRLRAEYLYFSRQYTNIVFNFTSGDPCRFDWWYSGYRPVVTGNRVNWKKQAGFDYGYPNFRKYLTKVYAYAGTLSLERELDPRASVANMQIGDVFIKGGSPGHAVIVLDMAAKSGSAEKVFLLGQSYMPAQDFHILKNPNSPDRSPWYAITICGDLATPEWRFDWSQLKHFPE